MSPAPSRPEWGLRPAGDDDGWEQLSVKKLVVGPIQALMSLAVPFIAGVLGASRSDSSWFAWGLLGVAVLVSILGVIPWWTDRFRVTDVQFQFRRGLFNRTTVSVPLDRVRSVDLEAKLLHRVLGLRTVQVGTGVDDDRVTLNGIDTPRAEQLRRHLLQRRTEPGLSTSSTHEADGAQDAASTPGTAPATTPAVPAYGSGAYGPAARESDQESAFAPADQTSEHLPHDTESGRRGAQATDRLSGRERELARMNWSWLRFAPFDLTRLAVVAAAVGLIFQASGDDLVPDSVWEGVDASAQKALEWSLTVLVISIVVGAVVLWVALALVGYVLQWHGLRLTSSDGSLHMTHGLLSTRSISVEEKRVRGVEITEPLLLRPVSGANLFTLATGVGSEGKTRILPQAPTSVAQRVGGEVLGTDDPLRVPLTQHGWASRRRLHVGFQIDAIALIVIGLCAHSLVEWLGDLDLARNWFAAPGIAYIFVAPALAELSYAHLGHHLTDTHLVVGGGTTKRTRTVLEVDGIIGWAIESSWFQRRVGLCTLVATTAAGDEKVELPDVRADVALDLVRQASPETVAPFLSRPAGVADGRPDRLGV